MRRCAVALVFVFLAGLLPREAMSQKTIEACDREIRVTNPVILETPRGVASGRVCFDDGDSLTIGPPGYGSKHSMPRTSGVIA